MGSEKSQEGFAILEIVLGMLLLMVILLPGSSQVREALLKRTFKRSRIHATQVSLANFSANEKAEFAKKFSQRFSSSLLVPSSNEEVDKPGDALPVPVFAARFSAPGYKKVLQDNTPQFPTGSEGFITGIMTDSLAIQAGACYAEVAARCKFNPICLGLQSAATKLALETRRRPDQFCPQVMQIAKKARNLAVSIVPSGLKALRVKNTIELSRPR